ncbi:MAG: nuclear transport factor 2 family protein [Pyrinomonadaceae bacterium]|nr:nuclear transport factor 2 family protein [Pyrinomonadaceae bacterium]
MKLLLILTPVVLMAAIFSPGEEQLTKTQALVREIERTLTTALQRGDSASVDAILADDYIEIDAQGLVRHKPDVMATVRAQASAPRSTSVGPEITVNETEVRIYGDTAVLIGLKTTKYQFMEYQALPQPAQPPAPSVTDQHRFMKVYSKLHGHWQLVTSQTTAIAKR